MRKKNKKQNGFAVVTVIAFIVILGLVGVIGWRVYDAQSATPNQQAQVVPVKTETGAPTIDPLTSAKDVDSVQATLDAVNVESDLETSVLEQDINDLL